MGFRMADCFKLTGIAFVLFYASAPKLFAQSQWQYERSEHEYGLRQAFIEQESVVLGSTCSVRLQFNATQDNQHGDGVLAVEFTVFPMSSIRDFDFEYFEGPFAPVGGQKLMRVTVTNDVGTFVREFSPVGFLSSERGGHGFVFAANSLTRNKQSDVREVLEQTLQGAKSLEVSVVDGKDHAIVLSAAFPLAGSEPIIRALLNGI